MRLEHHLVGGYVRYISPHIIIIIIKLSSLLIFFCSHTCEKVLNYKPVVQCNVLYSSSYTSTFHEYRKR